MNHHSFSAVFLPWDGVVHDAYVDLRVAMDNQVYVLFACMHFFQLFSADRLRGVPLGSYATCLGCLANAPTFWGGVRTTNLKLTEETYGKVEKPRRSRARA